MINSIPDNAMFLSLDPVKYPDFNDLPATIFVKTEKNFFAAQFYRYVTIPAGKNPAAHIKIFADTKFRLTVNGNIIGVGPIAAGGDYGNCKPMPVQYFNCYDVPLNGEVFEILAEVQSPGLVMTDYSVGKGGFIFAAEVTYSDREPFMIVSDTEWKVRHDVRFDSAFSADLSRELPEWEMPAVIPQTESPWNPVYAGIPPLTEEIILPDDMVKTDGRIFFDFSRIYSAYIMLECDNSSERKQDICIYVSELGKSDDGIPSSPTEKIIVPCGKSTYRGFRMWSTGAVDVVCSDEVEVKLSLVYTRYPADKSISGDFKCSDEMLTGIYKLGKFTLEMCCQTLHLDSPLHQETLGCTGDYAIESLINAVTFGDMRLTRLDLIRTAEFLRLSNGFMFHTSYSLIFVTMLYDYYMYTADSALVCELMPTVDMLFKRFAAYIDGGVIDNPPNYMFIEWGELDGFNLHHPPKALGQTALNAFYRMALLACAKLNNIIGRTSEANKIELQTEIHRQACIGKFFDSDKGIFFDGIPSPESDYEPNAWLPSNAKRRYYTRHSNILAALSGLVGGEEGRKLTEHVVTKPEDFESFDIQPYFMHYLMEAVRKYDLFGKYGFKLIHLWDEMLINSPKGMPEGWGKFKGDHSHAWGATPTYQLPMAVSGFEMTEAGYKAFRLSPKLYSLDSAELSLPTPNGLLSIRLKKGAEPIIELPEGAVFDNGVYYCRIIDNL